jgi:predicted small lipoprotein YifL
MMLKKLFAWSSLILAVPFLTGCGQTGHLYLPTPQTPQMAQTAHPTHFSAKNQSQTK